MNTHNPVNPRYGHRCYNFCTKGVVQYDPNSSRKAEPHWCIIEVEKDITRYYRELFKKKFGIILYSPAFDAHVSVLRGMGEVTEKMTTDWRYLDGKETEIWYDPNIYWNEQHVWLNTYCEDYYNIREFYGVENWNTHNFSHLTIGKFTPN